MCFSDANSGYAVSDLGAIFTSFDGGITWNSDYSQTMNGLYSVFFTDANTGYVAGNYGTILKTTNGAAVGIPFITPQAGTLKIYPNPVRDFCTVETSLSTGEKSVVISMSADRLSYNGILPVNRYKLT